MLNHSVLIQSSFQEVFETCRDVEKWESFMPAVKKAKFISSSKKSDTVEITAQANNQVWTWRSNRIIDLEAGIIRFERATPTENIRRISGFWKISSLPNGCCELSLEHEFELINEDFEMVLFLKKSIRSNATRDLKAIKILLEGKDE